MIRESVQVERSFESVAPASPTAISIPVPVAGSGSGSGSDSGSSSSSSSDSESDHDHSEEHSTHSAELQTQTISTHLLDERLTEAEKNERLQKKLMVSSETWEHSNFLMLHIFLLLFLFVVLLLCKEEQRGSKSIHILCLRKRTCVTVKK